MPSTTGEKIADWTAALSGLGTLLAMWSRNGDRTGEGVKAVTAIIKNKEKLGEVIQKFPKAFGLGFTDEAETLRLMTRVVGIDELKVATKIGPRRAQLDKLLRVMHVMSDYEKYLFVMAFTNIEVQPAKWTKDDDGKPVAHNDPEKDERLIALQLIASLVPAVVDSNHDAEQAAMRAVVDKLYDMHVVKKSAALELWRKVSTEVRTFFREHGVSSIAEFNRSPSVRAWLDKRLEPRYVSRNILSRIMLATLPSGLYKPVPFLYKCGIKKPKTYFFPLLRALGIKTGVENG
jgi:hypothetical protein